MAYGQTGSGKTFTMGGGGYDTDEGVIPRVINDLCDGIVERTEDQFELKVSYLEVCIQNITHATVRTICHWQILLVLCELSCLIVYCITK